MQTIQELTTAAVSSANRFHRKVKWIWLFAILLVADYSYGPAYRVMLHATRHIPFCMQGLLTNMSQCTEPMFSHWQCVAGAWAASLLIAGAGFLLAAYKASPVNWLFNESLSGFRLRLRYGLPDKKLARIIKVTSTAFEWIGVACCFVGITIAVLVVMPATQGISII